MPKHIVIVGGGVGGTIAANLLARSLHHQEAEITLIDSTGKHAYMPGWLYLPFNHLSAESDQLIRPESSLLNNQVHLVTGDVQQIDSQSRELHVHPSQGLDEIVGTGGASEAVYPYDYLVLATGARLVSSDLPGLAGTERKWHHFYSAEGSFQLRQALHTFEGGRIVITVGGIPYRCPPAPYEHPPHPPRPSLYYHMEKQLFNRAYWHIVPQGLV